MISWKKKFFKYQQKIKELCKNAFTEEINLKTHLHFLFMSDNSGKILLIIKLTDPNFYHTLRD